MFLSLVMLPVVVLGQSGTIKLSFDSAVGTTVDAVSFGKGRCGSTQAVNYDAQLFSAACSSLKFWVTDTNDCANEPSTSNLDWVFEVPQLDLVNLRKTGTFNVPLNELPLFQRLEADGGVGCGVEDEKRHRVCGAVHVQTGFPLACPTNIAPVKAGPTLFIDYDVKRPAPPVLSAGEGGDSRVSLTVSFPTDDVKKVRLQMKRYAEPDGGPVSEGGEADFQNQGEELVKPGAITVGGLTNGVTYAFRAYAYDAAGNESDESETVTVAPKFTAGFWDACVKADCPPGCSMVGFGPLSLVALVLVTAFRRLRR